MPSLGRPFQAELNALFRKSTFNMWVPAIHATNISFKVLHNTMLCFHISIELACTTGVTGCFVFKYYSCLMNANLYRFRHVIHTLFVWQGRDHHKDANKCSNAYLHKPTWPRIKKLLWNNETRMKNSMHTNLHIVHICEANKLLLNATLCTAFCCKKNRSHTIFQRCQFIQTTCYYIRMSVCRCEFSTFSHLYVMAVTRHWQQNPRRKIPHSRISVQELVHRNKSTY